RFQPIFSLPDHAYFRKALQQKSELVSRGLLVIHDQRIHRHSRFTPVRCEPNFGATRVYGACANWPTTVFSHSRLAGRNRDSSQRRGRISGPRGKSTFWPADAGNGLWRPIKTPLPHSVTLDGWSSQKCGYRIENS